MGYEGLCGVPTTKEIAFLIPEILQLWVDSIGLSNAPSLKKCSSLTWGNNYCVLNIIFDVASLIALR